MKLNLSLILNSIDCPHEYIKLDDSDPMRFIDAIPYLDNTYTSQNILYIFRWNQLQSYNGDIDTVLCIGGGIDAVHFFQKRQYSGAVFSQDLDILALLCNLRIIFNHYNQLELELMELLSQEATTKALLNKCADIFCAHVSLYDSNMSLIECSNLFAPSDEGVSELGKDIKDSITQKVSRDKVYMTPNIPGKFPVSSYISNDKLHSRFIYGFDSGDTRFATMIVYQTISPLNKNLNWMVDHIGKLLTPKIKERYSFRINQRNRLRNVLKFMLYHDSSDVILSQNDFTKYKWMPNDIYRLMIIHLPFDSQKISHYLYNYENIFSECYNDCIAFNFDEHIVIVFHGESCNLLDENLITLEKQLQMDDATCCIGLKFCDYNNIHTHYYYTVNGFRLLPHNIRIQYFKSILLQHMTASISSVLPLKALCHYAAVLVYRYDKENNTEFLLTLETYLMNNKSLIESANRLFVHKSTISYRLKCIERIVPINYNSPVERFEILASCIVLRCFKDLNSKDINDMI